MAYFTDEHFSLLHRFGTTRMDRADPELSQVYKSLQEAYAVTKAWAELVAARLFPNGEVRVRQRPTNQANNFATYNWARIYPAKDAPTALAYTVGIDASGDFIVKIDTVQLPENNPTRIAYVTLRGELDNSSPVAALLRKEEGLKMNLQQLTDWTVDAIQRFGYSYDDVISRIGLTKLSDDQILSRFDKKPDFKAYRERWSASDKRLFCRLARFAHEQGFDWWHVGRGIQVRFGRKEPNDDRAQGVIATVQGKSKRTLSLRRQLGDMATFKRVPLTDELVGRLEDALGSGLHFEEDWMEPRDNREGYWPDQIAHEVGGMIDEDQDESDRERDEEGPRNHIYYGPPGTGKTFTVSKLLASDYEQTVSSDGSEEWRSQFILEHIGKMSWWEAMGAALQDMGGRATVSRILEHPFVQAVSVTKGRTRNVRQTLWTTLLMKSDRSEEGDPSSGKPVFRQVGTAEWELTANWEATGAAVNEVLQQLARGPISETKIIRHRFVTFHQSYGYEDFIEGLRPVIDGNDDRVLRYEIRPGVFKDLCEQARLTPEHRFAMVIDEINRGNISKIFGELITLVEVDKREGGAHPLSTILPYSGERFSIPRNVDIIATMNTADRSLALLDTALRRRFEFFPLLPNTATDGDNPLAGTDVHVGEKVIEVSRLLETMNRRIEILYDKDHCIGHAYFSSIKPLERPDRFKELAKIFRTRIVPLLEEYFFDDWKKIRLVLGDNQKGTDLQFVLALENSEALLSNLFGDEHELDAVASAPRYEVQPGAFDLADSYIGIYQKV